MPVITVWRDGEKSVIEFEKGALLDDVLRANGFSYRRPCGGRGSCGKCLIEVTGDISSQNEAERRFGGRLSCQTRLYGDCEAKLAPEETAWRIQTDSVEVSDIISPMPGKIGAAVDIGTTTLALKLFDLSNGTLIGTSSAVNPQTSVAADVMGRISAAINGGLSVLRDQITSAIERLIEEAGKGVTDADVIVATGNTTMLYLLSGRDPVSLSKAPFEADWLFDETTSLMGRLCYIPPCMNAFVGADITCALLACEILKNERCALLCDIGTNGEIALWREGKLYVTSTAAGPAFEGAGISRGVGSVKGAIDRAWVENNRVGAGTIGGVKAVGICGSGLIDAIAAFLQLGEIDETGAIHEDALPIIDGVSLTAKDVRAVQLAKAAIAAGIITLAEEAGISVSDIETVYIAGGFGSRLNVASARIIGLIPLSLKGRVNIVGNAALAGGVRMLLNKESIVEARNIARKSKHVSLGGNPRFNDNYIEQMLFPEI